jgi:hypothetical protein
LRVAKKALVDYMSSHAACEDSSMKKDDSTTRLTLVNGGRADLELEALLSIPFDFEKTKRIFKTLARSANSPLKAVPPNSKEDSDESLPDSSRP